MHPGGDAGRWLGRQGLDGGTYFVQVSSGAYTDGAVSRSLSYFGIQAISNQSLHLRPQHTPIPLTLIR